MRADHLEIHQDKTPRSCKGDVLTQFQSVGNPEVPDRQLGRGLPALDLVFGKLRRYPPLAAIQFHRCCQGTQFRAVWPFHCAGTASRLALQGNLIVHQGIGRLVGGVIIRVGQYQYQPKAQQRMFHRFVGPGICPGTVMQMQPFRLINRAIQGTARAEPPRTIRSGEILTLILLVVCCAGTTLSAHMRPTGETSASQLVAPVIRALYCFVPRGERLLK